MNRRWLNQLRCVGLGAICLSLSACASVNLPLLKLLDQQQSSTGFGQSVTQPEVAETAVTAVSDDAAQFAQPAAFASIGGNATRQKISPVSFRPAESRRGIVRLGAVGEPVSEIVTPAESVHDYPDEFLFDGGDRNHPVHYDRNLRFGLDTEDTIGEYTDHTGENHTRKSNRVAIYSPRFAAVRTISGTEEGYNIDRVAGAHKSMGGFGVAASEGIVSHTDADRISGFRVRSRPSSVNVDQTDTYVSRVNRRYEHVLLQNAFEDRSFAQRAQFNRTSSAWLAKGMQNAAAWAMDISLQVTATTSAAIEIKAEIKPESMVGVDDGKRTKGNLRIMKIADRQVAEIGDEITFTIRYDNIGDHDLSNIVILDNLTPRLAYVEDSDTSNRPGELVIEQNGQGSHTLKFIIDDPIPGHEGGVLQFKARVR